jgi:GMP reductase
MKKVYHYSDIYLQPRFSTLDTRAKADLRFQWGRFVFRHCATPANMSSVINEDLAIWCSKQQYPYFYHRFGDTFNFVKRANEEGCPVVAISLGVKNSDKDLLNKIITSEYKVDIILLDIAHGFSQLMKEMVEYIKSFDSNIFIVAGNVWGDKDSIKALENWGADAIKVGLSCGAGCSTYAQTGFGSPMFSAALEAGKWASVPLIIDGGIRCNGDIAKALVAVLNNNDKIPLVMAGSIFAACIDAPGENIHKDNPVFISTNFGNDPLKLSHYGNDGPITHKRYYGSASAKQKGAKKNVEGFEL